MRRHHQAGSPNASTRKSIRRRVFIWAKRADDWLSRLGVVHETHLYAAGHGNAPGMQADFLDWFARLCPPAGDTR
jgi:hypothetical protein